MTNSTPKMNEKVKRQSPNTSSSKKRPWGGSGRQTYFSNKSKFSSPVSQTPSAGPRLSASPCGKSYARSADSSGYSSSSSTSSSSSLSSRSSGTGSPTNNFFAGSKWSDPPSPATLPQPPSHWTPTGCQQTHDSLMTNHLKMLLNVKA